MKYFVKLKDCVNTHYHEFFIGKWDEKTFWKEDSIFLHDDILFENKDFTDAIFEVIPQYDPFGETEISVEQWHTIGEIIKQKDLVSRELYQEVNAWVEIMLKDQGCFTILGI